MFINEATTFPLILFNRPYYHMETHYFARREWTSIWSLAKLYSLSFYISVIVLDQRGHKMVSNAIVNILTPEKE
jgi:hypothetical protein